MKSSRNPKSIHRRSNYKQRSKNNRNPCPFFVASDSLVTVIQTGQIEQAIGAGLGKDKNLQYYFVDQKSGMTPEQKEQLAADQVRRAFKEQRPQERKLFSMIEIYVQNLEQI